MTTIHDASPATRVYCDLPEEFDIKARLDIGGACLTILSRPVDASNLEIRLLLDDGLVADLVVAELPGSRQWQVAAVHAWEKGPWMDMLVAHAHPSGDADKKWFGAMDTAQSSRDLDNLFW